MALTRVIPLYPDAAIKAGTEGICLATIRVEPGSPHPSVQIRLATNDAFADAVRQALSQWTFPFAHDALGPESYTGKITFYFVKINNNWRVLTMNDTFYVGPHFAAAEK